MAVVNPSFHLIISVLVLASVGEMVQAGDAATLAKRCQDGLGACGERLCDNPCCVRRCVAKYPDLNPKAFCSSSIGAQRLCLCEYNC
ncbi:defensin-like protein 182 [Sesamum indicum]|uniref:Defensin-like protein 182 n=1 Tax=Sesamum indicum TaxID=4182 RepID=A0A6I9TBL1_SESIN|nr:defensin-like protein 182 [Sesamum indicum]